MSKAANLYKQLIKNIQQLGDVECQQNPDYWDDDLSQIDLETRRAQIAGAKAICHDCPVKSLCAEYALAAHEPTGIWGGLTTKDRETLLTSNN